MDDKVALQDLAHALMLKHEMEQAHAETFVRTFFNLIEDGLAADRYVRIKGLGTFKLINVEARESVDVNTGERIEIEAHNRVVFSPEAGLRDTINKPFAHFETVVLNHDTHYDDLDDEMEERESELNDADEEEYVAEPRQYKTVNDESECSSPQIPADEQTPTESNSEIKTPIPPISVSRPELQPTYKHQTVSAASWCMYATILFCGILIGGLAAWFIMSGRRYISESELRMPTPSTTPKTMPVPDTVAKDTLPTESITAASDTTIKDAQLPSSESQQVPIVSTGTKASNSTGSKKVTLGDTVKYRTNGTMQNYTLKDGESLVKVALKFYGNKNLWPYLAEFNKEIIKNPDNVPTGTTIRIPKLVPR